MVFQQNSGILLTQFIRISSQIIFGFLYLTYLILIRRFQEIFKTPVRSGKFMFGEKFFSMVKPGIRIGKYLRCFYSNDPNFL